VNWIDVLYFNETAATGTANSFQLVMIDRSDTGAGNFDFEFNFDTIHWETGDASGGVNGLGGNSAWSGYGDGATLDGDGNLITPAAHSFALTGSGVNGAFLNGGANALITHSLNSGDPAVLGRYLFTSRFSSPPPPTEGGAVPLPSAAVLGLPLLGGLALMAARRRRRELSI
jgi:hypothetical protein